MQAKHGVKSNHISKECKELIFAMLARQPELRPSLQEILQDKWFKNTKRLPSEKIPLHFEERN